MEATLLSGGYQNRGTYKPDMSGFVDPELQKLLEKYAQIAGCDPKQVGGGKSSGTLQGAGDAEHASASGVPNWLDIFQSKAERSPEWGTKEQAWSRLMGAFFRAYFIDKYYAPNNMAIPANVEYFLLHLGKSNPLGKDWKPKARPGYVGNGAAKFSVIGGGGANYCAAASSKALLNGLAMYGYKCKFIGYAPGGKGVGHGCPAKARQGRSPGEANRPLPGDVLSIRTAIGPTSGHVITVAWAQTDGTKSGEMWYVSGNSANASVSCDWARVCDAAGRPPRGSVAVINVVATNTLQPDKLEKLDDAGLSKVKMTRQAGDFPKAPKAGETSSGGAPAPGAPGAPGATAPGATPQNLPDAPKLETTLGSGDVQTCSGAAAAGSTVVRVGSRTSEPPPPAAPGTPSAAGTGGTPGAPGATAPGAPGAAPQPGAATPPPNNPADPKPPQFLEAVNLMPIPNSGIASATDIAGIARFVGQRAKQGIADVFASPHYNTIADSPAERIARAVAEYQTGIPYTMPCYFYKGGQKGAFKLIKEQGHLPLAGQCQQSVSTVLGMIGWDGGFAGDIGSGTGTPSAFRGGSARFWKPSEVPSSYEKWSETMWNEVKVGTCFMWAKTPGIGHIAVITRKHPTKRAVQTWDTCGTATPPGVARGTLRESGWLTTLRRHCGGPFLGLGCFTNLTQLKHASYKPRGEARLAIWQRGGDQVHYASDWLDITAKHLPTTWMLRSLRGAPFFPELVCAWLIRGTNKKPLLTLYVNKEGQACVSWKDKKHPKTGKPLRFHSSQGTEAKARFSAKTIGQPADPLA